MSLEMSLNLTDFKGKPIIGAEMRFRKSRFSVYIHVPDKILQERMVKDNLLIKQFVNENRKEIELFLIDELNKMRSDTK